MKNRIFNFLLTAVLLAALALNATPADEMLAAAEKTEAGLIAMADGAKNTTNDKGKVILDPVAYEAMVLAYQACVADPTSQYDFKSDYVTKAMNAIRKKYVMPSTDEFLPRLLVHENANIRAKALSLMPTFLLGISNKNSKICQDMLENEKDPIVIAQLIKNLRNEGNKNQDIAKFLTAQLFSENAEIRYVAVIHCSSSWNSKVKPMAEKMADMILNEKEAKVRSAACARASRLGDEIVIPSLVKVLDSKQDAKFHKDAVTGLMVLWWDFPLYSYASETAYTVTLKYLKEWPVAKNSPMEAALDALSKSSSQEKTIKAWQEKSASFFKGEDVQLLLLPYLENQELKPYIRVRALSALYNMGYPKEKLVEFVDQYEASGAKPADVKNFRSALEKLK